MGERCVAAAESVVALTDKASRRSTFLPEATAQALRAFSCRTSGVPPREGIHLNAERGASE
jgi:hypothetical protein